jgi:hypothetical protein
VVAESLDVKYSIGTMSILTTTDISLNKKNITTPVRNGGVPSRKQWIKGEMRKQQQHPSVKLVDDQPKPKPKNTSPMNTPSQLVFNNSTLQLSPNSLPVGTGARTGGRRRRIVSQGGDGVSPTSGAFFAGAKFSVSPSPAAIPLPPVSWMIGASSPIVHKENTNNYATPVRLTPYQLIAAAAAS